MEVWLALWAMIKFVTAFILAGFVGCYLDRKGWSENASFVTAVIALFFFLALFFFVGRIIMN